MSYTIYTNPNRTQWLEFRKQGIGGSDVAPLLGESPWTTPLTLWEQKKGIIEAEDISDKPKVKGGVVLEPVIRNLFAENHPELMVFDTSIDGAITTFVSNERPWAMADLDGIALDLNNPSAKPAVVEIKTAHQPFAKDWGPSGSGASGVPKHYLDQVNHYFSITDWDKAYVVVYIDGYDYREYEIDRNDLQVEILANAVDTFWKGYVLGNVRPPAETRADSKVLTQQHKDPSEKFKVIKDEDEANQISDIVNAWIEARTAASEAKTAEEKAAAQLKEMIGDNKGLALDAGNVIWVRTKRPRSDTKAMAADDQAVVDAYNDLKKRHTYMATTDGGIRWSPRKKK